MTFVDRPMLTTLVTQLQTLISTRFLVASFFPSLAFWFGHAAMLYLYNPPFQALVRNHIGDAGLTTLLIVAALIGVAITAYAFSAVLPTIQSILEGNWPQSLISLFAPSEVRSFERIERALQENLRLRAGFRTLPDGRTQVKAWQEELRDARREGEALGTNNYTMNDPGAQAVAGLANRRRSARAIPASEITNAVNLLLRDLRANNANVRGPDNELTLENTRQLLWNLIDYADRYVANQYRSIIMKRYFSFGAAPLAPTRMGNVAKTVQTYAIERYNLNFELFWSRMQLPAQRDKDFGPVLQAAKTQLDFLISSSVLTFLWAIIWAVWLLVSSGPPLLFLVIALLGPLVAYAWYWVAVAHYRTFADVLRSSIDLFRFDLLAALHYPRPDSVQEEYDLWQTIDALHALYELHDARYVHPKSPS